VLNDEILNLHCQFSTIIVHDISIEVFQTLINYFYEDISQEEFIKHR